MNLKKNHFMGFICIVISLTCVFVSLFFLSCNHTVVTMTHPNRFQDTTLIIDPGHGGEDGGAVSADGGIESGINLAIATRLDTILGLFGADVRMTRTTDISLHDATAQTIREKKVSDLKNRVRFIESTPGAVLLSIHQNMFTDTRYHGAQVFYGKGADDAQMGEHVQSVLGAAIDPNNSRAATQISDSVYLMNHITCPAILVECGFLSNPEESALLQSTAYQTKLAAVLAGAYISYDNNAKEESIQ